MAIAALMLLAVINLCVVPHLPRTEQVTNIAFFGIFYLAMVLSYLVG